MSSLSSHPARQSKHGKGSQAHRQGAKRTNKSRQEQVDISRKILVLHGSRQTGQLLLGRMDKLRKKLSKKGIGLVAPDAPFPHPEDGDMRQWWNRDGNALHGLDQSLTMLQDVWKSDGSFIGILGFSMGARMTHLIVQASEGGLNVFDGIQFVIMVAGYEAPTPTNLALDDQDQSVLLHTPSLHVCGNTDRLIPASQSLAVMKYYTDATAHEHEGGHHVPMRAANVEAYLEFIDLHINVVEQPEEQGSNNRQVESTVDKTTSLIVEAPAGISDSKPAPIRQAPDEESVEAQRDEVEALQAIFPEEFELLSKSDGDGDNYEHPISYSIALIQDDQLDGSWWPPHPIKLKVTYPYNYPNDTMPDIKFLHDNNMMEFTSGQMQALLEKIHEVCLQEMGMPSVLSSIYAAREFFESGEAGTIAADYQATVSTSKAITDDNENDDTDNDREEEMTPFGIRSSPKQRIEACNLEGLQIATNLLRRKKKNTTGENDDNDDSVSGKGGSWQYSIGLVGKPSAGKSTFFNAATAFARQRDDKDNALGGATMAPHPFTTIDPNVGYCLVPAPIGSCPEDDDESYRGQVGSTHGRDASGRRFIPVMLKDVAGLVPGAYQGRGRGNKFLNDLTDATVLIHVVDASGTADTEGNNVGTVDGDGASNPLEDLAWILNELVEWVYANLMHKWETVKKKGRDKLAGMFSGYGQTRALLYDILYAVEKYMDQELGRDHALDHLEQFDEGDVHRLVSAFLGVRFPMALALNKEDLPSAQAFVTDIKAALPIHGAHVGIPMSARKEMTFVKSHIQNKEETNEMQAPPFRVWQCLQEAVGLREPVLVFPVVDMTTYEPLPGLGRQAIEDASLPNTGMINCIQAAGGEAPSLWDGTVYDVKRASRMLRDVLVMKAGSTVEDVFLALKNKGALGGEFIRAEGAGRLGEKAKLIPKSDLITRHNRILKIMTSKRREWQNRS